MLVAGVALAIYFAFIRFDSEWQKHWKHHLFIGVLNSAIPFFLFSFAAMHIPAGYSAILNSTTPLFAVIMGSIWLGESLTIQKISGIFFGIVGVMLVTKIGADNNSPMFGYAVAACLAAPVCYSLSGIYIKKFMHNVKPMATACVSQLLAGMIMLPATILSPVKGEVTVTIMVYTIVFGVMCSAVAYILYYRLVASNGPTKALTVTFITPVFAMLWAALLLGEPITPRMIAGGFMILLGAGMVIRNQKTAKAA